MKRILYLAAALITVAACGREPAVTEKPSEEPEVGEKLLDVTLIAGNPETRTEVFFDPEVNQFRPFWSAGMETIELGNLNPGNPEFESIFRYGGFAFVFACVYRFGSCRNVRGVLSCMA